MTDHLIYLPDLETAFAALYRGPLEEFVGRRAELVKQLRTSKRREDADAAKVLRKPSRPAWALDNAVLDDPEPIERLAAAVNAALDAQSGGSGDLRTALDVVRTAARDIADAAARSAADHGYRLESSTLVPAVMAVIGDAGAFAALRAGRLAEIPEGGGLDFLTAAPPASQSAPAAADRQGETHDDVVAETASAELEQAEASLARARERSRAAERALMDARARLNAAEAQLRQAQDEVADLRAEFERAGLDAKAIGLEVQEAERALEGAR